MIRRAGEPRGRQGRIRPALGALLAVGAAALGGESPATAAPPSVGGTLDLAQSGILLAGASQSTPLNASLFQHEHPTDQPRPDDLPASVAFAGDVNGDGVSDMAVGAPLADFAGRVRAGTVTVVFGKRLPAARVDLAHLGDQGLVIGGPEKGARAGTSVASLGDVNGDGYGDLLVGAPRTSTPGRGRSAGMAFVVLGGPAAGTIDLAAGQGRTVALPGAAHGDHAGMAVAAVGDLDGDGRAEAVVGAPDADPAGRDRAGSAYVISSGRLLGGGDLQTAGYRIDGPSPFARLGAAVAGTADMDRDGLGEILLGAPGPLDGGPSAPPTSSGAYLVAGRASSGTIDLAAGDARTRVITGPADQGAGFAVADAGDVDGDGTHDILVGAPLTSLPGRLSSGRAYVVRGRTDPAPVSLGDSTRDVIRIDGARANDRLGTSVAGAGDVDVDGRAEVLLGAPGAYALGRSLPGAAYLVAAQSVDLALPGVAALRLAGIDRPSAFAGTSVAGGTDVDGDRRPDVLVGWYPGSAGLVLSPTLPTALPARPRTGSSCTTPATNVEVIIAESLAASDTVTGARAAALEALLVRPRTQPTTIGAVAFGTRALELFAPTTVGPQGFTGPFDLLRALIAERLQQGHGLGDERRLSAGFAASATDNPGRGAQILITDGASAPGPDPTAVEAGVPTFVIGMRVGAASDDGQRLGRLAERSGGRFFPDVTFAGLPAAITAADAAASCEVPVPVTVTDISPLGTVLPAPGGTAPGAPADAAVVALPPGGEASLASTPVPSSRGATLTVSGNWRDRTARFGVASFDLVRTGRPAIHVPARVLRRARSRGRATYRTLQLRARQGRTFFVIRVRVPATVAAAAPVRAAQSSSRRGAIGFKPVKIYHKKMHKKKHKGHAVAAALVPSVSAGRRVVRVQITRSVQRRGR